MQSSIFALSIALISLIVSIKYINLYKKLSDSTKQLSITCSNNSINSKTILEIQQNLDLTDNEFNDAINNNKNEIIKIIKSNINPKPVIDNTKSNSSSDIPKDNNSIKVTKPTTDIQKDEGTKKLTKSTTDIQKDKIDETNTEKKIPKSKKEINTEKFEDYKYFNIEQRGIKDDYNYSNLIDNQNKIENIDDTDYLNEEVKIDKTLEYIYKFHDTNNINNMDNEFVKRNLCLVNHDNKQYCFETNINNCYGIGTIVKNNEKCSNKI